MKIARSLIAAFLVIMSLFVTGVAIANAETNVSRGLTAKGRGVTIYGDDVVVYCADGRPRVGKAKYSTGYNDVTHRFANEAHLRAFKDNPKRNLPQYGGYAAYGVAVGAKLDGDPHLRRIVNGKFYLNFNPKIQERWRSDVPSDVKKADRSWSRIATKTPKDLSRSLVVEAAGNGPCHNSNLRKETLRC